MKKHVRAGLCRFVCAALVLFGVLQISVLEAAYTLKVRAACDDALYGINEPVLFIVTLTTDSPTTTPVPASTTATWTLSKDSVAPMTSGTVTLVNGVGEITGTLAEPGFLQAQVGWTPAGGTALSALAGAGIAPELITPSMAMPSDFIDFWQAQKAALAQIPLNIRYTPVRTTAKMEVVDVQADSIDGVPVSGYLSRPINARPGSRPAILTLQGAGVNSAGELASWVDYGFIALNINAHGIPNGQPAAYYTDLANGALKGYSFFGRESRDTSYFRGMFMRLVRAIDVLAQQPEWDGKTIVVYGTSQGGAQAIAAAGLDSRVTFVAAGVSAMCDHTGMVVNRVAGWPRWIASNDGVPNPAMLEASRYYDMVNFASLIRVGGTFTVGFIDRTCAPTTVYAMYNVWGGAQKNMFNDIETGHANTPPATASMVADVRAHAEAQNVGIFFVRGSTSVIDPGGFIDLTIRVGRGISSVTISNGVGQVPVDSEGYATVRVYPQGSVLYTVTAQDSGGTVYSDTFEVTQAPPVPLDVRSSAVEGSNYVINFTGKPNTTYAVKGSLTLENFNDDFGTVTTNAQGEGRAQIAINPSESKRFFRIEVIR